MTTAATLEARMTSTLDEIEERLPMLPASVLRLERSLAGRAYDTAAVAVDNLRGSIHRVASRTDHAARTVLGTARRAATNTIDAARLGARTTTGQTTAQAQRVGGAVTAEVADIHEDAVGAVKRAIRTIDPENDATTGYDRWTRADLYEKAAELEIQGRSTMSKAELAEAIRNN